MSKVALSFLAHPDDAEFLCAGTLARLADAGWNVHIATATPGDCGSATQDRWEISAVRTQEAARAAAMIGATYHCLDERDIFVVFDKPTLQKTIDLFRRVAPSLVFTHAPKDYMMDHEMASMLACHASQREWLRVHHGMDQYMEAMRRHAAERGRAIGVDYAEAFVQHRGHAYPHDDLLAKLFA